MVTVVNVCAWCNRELSESNEPGRKYEKGCTSAMVSHGCCNQCRRGVDAEIKACRTSRRLDRAVKLHLRMKAIDLILSGVDLEKRA